MADESQAAQALECNLPASIAIEEMIIGRLTAKQLSAIVIGSAISYQLMFKMPNKVLGWILGAIIAGLVYVLAFRKIKKYDRYLYEHWWYYYKYYTEQQLFINK